MNKTTTFLLTVIMALSLFLGATIQSKAQNKSFAGVVPFVTSNDRVGFFEQSSGRVYVYDSNLTNCLFVGQLQSLGKPVEPVASVSTSTNVNQ